MENRKMKTFALQTLALMISVLSFPSSRSCGADKEIWEGAKQLVVAVGSWLEKEGFDRRITVGLFQDDDGAANAEFKRLFEVACKKSEMPLEVRRSDILVSGRLKKSKPKTGDEKMSLQVEVTVAEREGSKKENITIRLGGDEAIHFLSPTVEFAADSSEKERDEKLDVQLSSKSKAFIEGDITLGADKGEFGVEVRVVPKPGADSVPAKPADVDGQSFVKLSQQQEYIVRLYNRSQKEAATTLTIDGLSMFAFAKDGSEDSLVIIPPESHVDVVGWYVDSTNTDAFEVSEYADSAAAAQNLPQGNIGVITARFHESLPATAKGGEATKRGRRIEQKYEQVQRSLGSVRAYVTVRYNRDGQ